MTRQQVFFRFPVAVAAVFAFLLVAGCSRTESPGTDSAGAEGASQSAPAAGAVKTSKPGGPGAAGTARTASTPTSAKPAAAAPKPVVIPEGTAIAVRTTTALSTKTAAAGERFAATLDEPLVVAGKTIAPKGAEVTGRIVESDPGGRVKGVASLSLRLAAIEVEGGREVEITTGVYTREAPTSKKNDAIKVGVASGVGAAIGAIAGGGKGAAIGAGAGAGAGTGVVLATHGKPAEIPAESRLKFTLNAPVTVTP